VIIDVIAVARHEDGMPHWTYQHTEQYVPTGDEEKDTIAMAAMVQRRLDEARGSVSDQAGVDLSRRLWEVGPGEEGSYGS
jgi:transposase